MKHLPIPRILLVALFPALGASAQQETISILLDDTTLGESITVGESVTSGGVKMTFTDVLATDGGNMAAVDDFGILFGTETSSNDVASITISFDLDVAIAAYTIGSREDVPAGTYFTLTGGEASSGQNPVPEIDGFTEQEIRLDFVPGQLPVLEAGQTYTITHNLLDATNHDPIFNLESLSVSVLPGNQLPDDFVPMVDLDSGWNYTPWFGSFNASYAPWVYHAQHGWLYLIDGDSNGFFIWDGAMNSFLWTSGSIYPSLYRFSDGKWLFYQKGSKNPRNFVDLTTGVWEQW